MIRRRGSVLTEWALVFTLVLAPMIVIGGSLYGWMTSSSILSRVVATAGERFASTGLSTVLRSMGHDVGRSAADRHRRRECKCP